MRPLPDPIVEENFRRIRRRKILAAVAGVLSFVTAGCTSNASETDVATTAPDGETDSSTTSERLTSTSNGDRQEVTYADVVVTHPRTADVDQAVTLEFRVTPRRALSAYRVELRPPEAFEEPTEPLVWEFTDLEPGEQVEWTATLRAERPTDDLLLVRSIGRPAEEDYDFERTMAIRILIGGTDGTETGPGAEAEQVTTTEEDGS